MTAPDVPAYDELPTIDALGLRTSWGILRGELGTLDFLAESAVRDAAHRVQSGQVIALSIDSTLLRPPLNGRPTIKHEFQSTGRNIYEDELGEFNPQSGSQWDGLAHVRAREFGFYGGITELEEARERLGVHHWGLRGIAGRGVLVDVARHRETTGIAWDPFAGQVIEADEIRAILAAQGTELQPGDILCLRLGWLAEYRLRQLRGAEGLADAGLRFSGVAANDDMVRFLWDARIAAVAADNPAVESAPGDAVSGWLHRKLIPGLGFALAELLDFDALADACTAREQYDFLFVAAPMALHGGASSPANAVAIL
ncbi:cyclase family protein [Cryobacterium sp. TMS1-20-1]|uniref:cyclase family protein n=1 Tax=Cryobacterium sp. TMS1-20-1 TaxID=1259223 RepID=UPI00106D99C7|nr:cyclase family protein [Cryobacterium sp. TMS1-20-1]TFC70954.1 cyclase family protein [Cryobacterium sp. TMS1-20-1]